MIIVMKIGFMKGSNPDGSQTYISKTLFLMKHEVYDKYRFVHLFEFITQLILVTFPVSLSGLLY
jgi:hypothetical protein